MSQTAGDQELSVTFHPALYLQRRGWVLDIMRRENITEVLDIGCGEGELLACLCNPAPWLAPPKQGLLPATHTYTPSSRDLLTGLHKGILHPRKITGLDISRVDLENTAQATKPPDHEQEPESSSCRTSWYRAPTRWEPLEVNIWEGSLDHVNHAFIDVECIVATEVIEHLPEDVLDRFGPVVLGVYQPCFLLITTPSYTFNARFTAPGAPREARSGWPDPTRRTDRIFRHHDHKFEWTVEEFDHWCRALADTWGYDIVEIGGVGKAREVDEWGRDEELGWASQVAAFKRREGRMWRERRMRQWERAQHLFTTEQMAGAHQLLAIHQHPVYEGACRPQPQEAVGELVVSKMVHFRETSIALAEMWFDVEIERACGGWVDWLVFAVELHPGLAVKKLCREPAYNDEWVIELDPSLHHLIPPETPYDPWTSTSPSDSDEIEEPWDDVDRNPRTHATGLAVVDAEEDRKNGGSWSWDESASTTFGGDLGWGEPLDGWGKAVNDLTATQAWGSESDE